MMQSPFDENDHQKNKDESADVTMNDVNFYRALSYASAVFIYYYARWQSVIQGVI